MRDCWCGAPTAVVPTARQSPEPLRIVVIAPPWFEVPPDGYGGIEYACGWLAEGLHALGHDVTVIGAGRRRTSARFLATYPEALSARVGEVALEVVHAGLAERLQRQLQADLVHDHTFVGALLAATRARPTVLTTQMPIDEDTRSLYMSVPARHALVAISESQRRSAAGLGWTATVPNGVPVSTYPSPRPKKAFALFLGRMTPEKAPHLAIDAARAAGVPLILAGKCAEAREMAYFEREIRPRLGSGVMWAGHVWGQRKKRLLAAACCLLFPSQWEEPFGLVMVEAMACGTPVVALRRGAPSEVVDDGRSGFLCDEPDQLAAALRRARELDPHDCHARAHRFDLHRMVAGYETVYMQVLTGALPSRGHER